MKKGKKIFLLITLIAFIFLFSIIFSLINLYNDKILYGVSINGVDISNLSKEQAKLLLVKKSEEKNISNLKINCFSEDDNHLEYTFETSLLPLNIQYNISDAIENAYSIGRNYNIFKNNYIILNTLINKKNIEINYSLDENNLNQMIDRLSSELPNKLIESSYYIEENNLIILKGSAGNMVKKDILKNDIYSLINDFSIQENIINTNLNYLLPDNIKLEEIHNKICKSAKNAYYEKEPFKIYPEIVGIDFDINIAQNILAEDKNEYIIPLNITTPDITINNLEINTFPDLLGSFSTKYDLQNESRSTNLSLASEKINETIIPSGSQFSYNSVVGARTIAAGYKEAKIYSNGNVVDGIGGGICQVSSTLYNAALFANLEIIERHPHQFITSYVSPGRDATVVYGSKDLKFVNNRSYPIKIICKANDGIIKISIYGIKENIEYDVNFDTETVSTIPYKTKYEYNSKLNSSEEIIKQLGANGSIVNSYKVIKLNGSIVSKTLISQDTYNALNRIIETGNYEETKILE